jgi:hypothetical protein
MNVEAQGSRDQAVKLGRRLAIMQPYFLPYIGYYQLVSAVDTFLIYDNIKYTKKGWINRNRLLLNEDAALFSLPLKKDSDALDVVQRELAADFDRGKLLNQFKGAYSRAPYFAQTYPLLERVVRCGEGNLFHYIHHSLNETCAHLGIRTEIRVSSTVDINHELRGQEKVLKLCRAMGAEMYVNAIGGTELYAKEDFKARGVELRFLKSKPFEYSQFGGPFVPWLSLVDVLMFNPLGVVQEYVTGSYDLV